MERHLSPAALVRLFSGQMAEAEVESASSHLVHCQPCGDLAAAVAAGLRKGNGLVRPPEGGNAVLTLLEVEDRVALRRLLARSRWAALKDLPAAEQTRRLLQTLEMFETVVADASAAVPDDPWIGEERALLALSLAARLPARCCSEASKHDLQSRALLVVADCRRKAGDQRGAAEAFKESRDHLTQGTGDPVCKTRFLAVQALLAADMGHLERAQIDLARAGEILRTMRDPAAVAAAAVDEAKVLLAAGRPQEAMQRAEDALRWSTPREARLDKTARRIITECLLALGRSDEALRDVFAAGPLSADLVARLLDAQGFARDAERAYRTSAASFLEDELYKEASLAMLARFESLVRRSGWDKAVQAGEDGLALSERAEAGCHAQIVELWRDLLALARARRLTDRHLLAARQFLERHWEVPAKSALLLCEGAAAPDGGEDPLHAWPVAEEPQPAAQAETGFVAVASLDSAKDGFERELIAKGLAQCGGCILETARLLDIARNTLRTKMRKYGLAGDDRSPGGPLAPVEAEKRARALDRLRAYSLWEELKRLPAPEQIERIETSPTLQTRELFEAVMAAASAAALDDPFRGEETALVAFSLANAIPSSRCPERSRHDLLSEALQVIGNCRRLTGDWPGSAAAFDLSQGHLEAGTGDPIREARLLSVQASLASETGNLERAQALLSRAAAIYLREQDSAALASVSVQEANTLLAAGRHEEARTGAEEALRVLTPRESRLEMLARSIITECLAVLRRPHEALRSLASTWPLYEQFWGRRTELRLRDLEALVLDALGYPQDAEAVFRYCIEGYLESELYKDAFLTMLTRFESLFRREAWAEAARACKEALAVEMRLEAEGHGQIIDLWRDLLALVKSQQLTADRVLEARHAVVRHWSSQPHRTRTEGGGSFLRWDANSTFMPAAAREAAALPPAGLFLAVEPPALPDNLADGGFHAALELFERKLIEAGLAQCHGQIRPAARLLGMSRGALRERVKNYGLCAVA